MSKQSNGEEAQIGDSISCGYVHVETVKSVQSTVAGLTTPEGYIGIIINWELKCVTFCGIGNVENVPESGTRSGDGNRSKDV
jgi:hypothetical protein